jgi:hypothetical protein
MGFTSNHVINSSLNLDKFIIILNKQDNYLSGISKFTSILCILDDFTLSNTLVAIN